MSRIESNLFFTFNSSSKVAFFSFLIGLGFLARGQFYFIHFFSEVGCSPWFEGELLSFILFYESDFSKKRAIPDHKLFKFFRG